MPKEFIYPVRVYYEDTDCNGIVHHTNYLKFMERGRVESLRSKGFSFRSAQGEQILFAVCSAQLEFLKPACLEDSLEVITQIIKVGGASMVFEQVIRDAQDPKTVFCTGIIKVACVNTATRPRPLPRSLLVRLKSDG